MPPKVKTDKDTIIKAAFEVIQNQGLSAVTAKNVSAQLGTSVGPIFREFINMEELKNTAITFAGDYYIEYLKTYPFERSRFMTYGLAYISFAQQEPRLFETLLLNGFFEMDTINRVVSNKLDFVLESAAEVGMISQEKQANTLFFNVWLYTHGIACLAGTGCLNVSNVEIKKMLYAAFCAFLNQINEGGPEELPDTLYSGKGGLV